MSVFVSAAIFAVIGVILGTFEQLYSLIVVTVAIAALLFIAVIIDNLPEIKSSGLGFLPLSACIALCILVPMWIAYLVRLL